MTVRGIEAAFFGVIAKDLELKQSRAGKAYASFSVGTDAGETDDGVKLTEWVRCTVFGDTAQQLSGKLHKGDRVYCEGSLKLDRWQSDQSEQKFGLSCACFKCEKVGTSAIGRNRPKIEKRFEQAGPAAYMASAIAYRRAIAQDQHSAKSRRS
jgi:single-stranded DNA-binding protein